MMTTCVSAAGVAGSAGATALGLGMGKTDLELSREVFKQQMQQTKRLWTADRAESSVRHGEQCLQSAQQHSEAQAISTAAYFQAEKLASQGIKLARDQDSRAYEMAWRAEVRESLRDELTNQNNRFNIVMLCDTVCLGCVFTLVADGSPPMETSVLILNIYIFCLGVSIMLFSVSLWGSVIVVRRLHDNTAASLERKLFVQSEDLQEVWKQQLSQNLPTGPHEIYLINKAFEKWVAEYLDPIGAATIHMMTIGIVTMFLSAGFLIHSKYLLEYKTSMSVPIIFWSLVLATSITMLFMKFLEDRKEKRKEGVYDVSWQDDSSHATGPFGKITKMAEELCNGTAVQLGSVDRIESYGRLERQERELCAKTQSLQQRVNSMQKEAESRAKTRKEVLQLLMTAAEELDALPEELTTRINKLIHSIEEADTLTSDLVAMQSESITIREASHKDWSQYGRLPPTPRPREPMECYPIDAQRIPVSLGSLRKKLGENPITCLLRIKNTSDEILRLKSGVQLTKGQYVKSINANDPHDNLVCYHLYPANEIPPRTELLVAAKNSGGAWVPTSGISGEIIYTTLDETWNFKIYFRNSLVKNIRDYRVDAYPTIGSEKGNQKQWQIAKDQFDHKINNEVVITIDLIQRQESTTFNNKRRSLFTVDSTSTESTNSSQRGCIELIHHDKGIEVLPV